MSMTANRHRKKAAKNHTPITKGESNAEILRGISIGRRYCEFEPPLEKGDLFRARPTANPIVEEGNSDNILPTHAFLDHINSTVVEQIFGDQMKPEVIRMLINGIADQVLVLVEQGHKVRIPNLMVASLRTLKAKSGRNPQTGETIELGQRTSIKIQPTYSAKKYFKQGHLE